VRYRRATQGLSCDAPYIPMRSLGHVNRRHHEETCVSHTGDFSGSGDARGALRLRCSQCPVDGGTIHGGRTANMTELVAAGFNGVSSFGFEATLFPTARPEGTSTALTTWATFPGTRATSSATLRDGHRTPTEPSPCSLLMGRSSGPTAASSRMAAWLLP